MSTYFPRYLRSNVEKQGRGYLLLYIFSLISDGFSVNVSTSCSILGNMSIKIWALAVHNQTNTDYAHIIPGLIIVFRIKKLVFNP